MHRFYCQNLDLTQDIITITDPNEIHHIKNVLRLKKHTEIKILSDNNLAVKARLVEITAHAITAEKVEDLQPIESTQTHITLACAIPKKGKFELIIEKTTELGIAEIFPMLTQRTEINISADRAANKQQRFIKIAQNAAKQSNRNSVPTVHAFIQFHECLAQLKSERFLILIPSLEEESQTLKSVYSDFLTDTAESITERIAILIGPEGDFTKEEYALAKEAGCIPVTLGPTVLKVETAAITAVAYLRQESIVSSCSLK